MKASFNRFILIIILSWLVTNTQAQFWNLNGNNPVLPANFLGSINNQSLKFRTTNIERMRINQNLNMNAAYLSPPSFIFSNANYPGYTPYTANGFVGINTDQPRTRLEIHGKQNLTPSFGTGWRPWMQTGITMTGNNDLSYFLA